MSVEQLPVEQSAAGWGEVAPAPAVSTASAPEPAPEPAPEESGGLDMRVLVEWVGDNIANLISRKVPATGGYPRWCRQWWYHAEAIVRFEVLRLAWNDLMGESGTSKAIYFRDYLDPTLHALMSDDGPFAKCTPERHLDAPALGQGDPPAEIFE